MFTIHHGFSQVSFPDLFHNYDYNFYSLQSQSDFQIPRINFEKNRVRMILWTSKKKNIPIEIRTIQNVDTFKTEITNGKPTLETVDVDYVKRM